MLNLLCRAAALAQTAGRSATGLGPIAQWLEQTTHNRLVGGSNPSGPTNFTMSAANGLLIFDDACRFCRGCVRVLQWLDWFNTVKPLPLSAADECVAQYSLSHEALMASMHLVTRDGRVFAGAEAVREFGLRMP